MLRRSRPLALPRELKKQRSKPKTKKNKNIVGPIELVLDVTHLKAGLEVENRFSNKGK